MQAALASDGHRWARAAASGAETHVLGGDVHQYTLAGDSDALNRHPQRQCRQRHGDVPQRAEQRDRDAACGDHHDADAAGAGPGHPGGGGPGDLAQAQAGGDRHPVRAAGGQREPWHRGHPGEPGEADQGGAAKLGGSPAVAAAPYPVQGEVELPDLHRSQFLAGCPDHDLVQAPGRHLGQEREARDAHVRLNGEPPVLDLPGQAVLGAEHRDPVGDEHHTKQRHHHGHDDHALHYGAGGRVMQASAIHPGTRSSSPGPAA